MKIIATLDAPAAIGPYVQGKIVNGLLYASGQIPLNPLNGEIVGDSIETQTEQVMKNLQYFSRFNAIYSKFFDKEFPARSAVGVAGLPKNVLIEIEVIAEVKS